MATSTLLILIAIGIITGTVSGMLGIGGAIVMIPALVFIMGLTQHSAQGTSLVVISMGLVPAYNYYKAGHVNLKFALVLAASFIVGSYFGSKFALTIPETTLKKIFSVMLLVVALRMLLSK